jgi:hypothetical protein
MSELVQLNLSVDRDLSDLVEELARHHGWTKRQAVTAAVEALKVLMKRHETTAAKASEEDVGELFLRVARLMPAGLTDAKVEWGRLSDGRPALIVRDWVIADDGSGDLMAVRRDGSQVGYLAHGDIEVLAERAFRGPTTPLKAPDQVALN